MRPLHIPNEFVGIHADMSAEQYHALQGASASLLREYWQTTPAHALSSILAGKKPTPPMVKGTMIHSIMLEPGKPLDGLAVIPAEYYSETDKKNKPWHASSNTCKAWMRETVRRGLQPISQSDYDDAANTAKAIATDPDAGPVFATGRGELTVCCYHAPTDQGIRCRLDWVPDAEDSIFDIKACRDVSDRGFEREIWDRGYHIQGSLYLDVWNALAPVECRKNHFVFVAAESKPPHCVRLFRLTDAMIELGRRAYTELLEVHAKCFRAKHWPGYPKGRKHVEPQPWQHAAQTYIH